MTQINTVRGPVNSGDLGVTLMHEHVFVLTADMQANHPSEWGSEEERVAEAVTKLQAAYDAGVRTIVDPTVVGLGRYIPGIRRIAEHGSPADCVGPGRPVGWRRRTSLAADGAALPVSHTTPDIPRECGHACQPTPAA